MSLQNLYSIGPHSIFTRKDMAITIITCKCCGKQEIAQTYRNLDADIAKAMLAEQLCFECAYWKLLIRNLKDYHIVIDGEVMFVRLLAKPTLRQARRNNGDFIIDLKTKEVYNAIGLASVGKIPERFIGQVQNTHKFITREEYIRIQGYDAEVCLSKGCFDRYHCVWYNAAIAEPAEPWNKIPKNYKIGSENCPSFVDKNVLHND